MRSDVRKGSENTPEAAPVIKATPFNNAAMYEGWLGSDRCLRSFKDCLAFGTFRSGPSTLHLTSLASASAFHFLFAVLA
jgi:hypothetical protein